VAITVPAFVGLKVTLQLDVVALTLANVHGDPMKLPAAVPPLVNATVPAGADAVPATEVSFANPVHVMTWFTTTASGVQDTAVDVVLRFTVTVLPAVGPLPEWTLSVGEYVPLAMTVPDAVGLNVTLQLEVVALTVANVHGDPVKLPVAVPPLVNATVPPGADGVPVAVSLTNPVHVMTWFTTTVAGVQDTDVAVDLPPTVTVLLVVGPLPLWVVSVGVYVALAIIVPVVLPVIVTLQLEVVALILTNVQGEPEIAAVAVPVLVTATVPAGADEVPAADVSRTNVVHVTA